MKDADVHRLTREEIEAAHDALCAAVALNLDMSKHWCEQKWKQAHMLRDLALQSLSQEAVRDEALEEAARVCEREAEAHRSFGNHAMRTPAGRQGAIAQEVAARNCSTLIRALKHEPNAAERATRSPYDANGLKEYSGD